MGPSGRRKVKAGACEEGANAGGYGAGLQPVSHAREIPATKAPLRRNSESLSKRHGRPRLPREYQLRKPLRTGALQTIGSSRTHFPAVLMRAQRAGQRVTPRNVALPAPFLSRGRPQIDYRPSLVQTVGRPQSATMPYAGHSRRHGAHPIPVRPQSSTRTLPLAAPPWTAPGATFIHCILAEGKVWRVPTSKSLFSRAGRRALRRQGTGAHPGAAL